MPNLILKLFLSSRRLFFCNKVGKIIFIKWNKAAIWKVQHDEIPDALLAQTDHYWQYFYTEIELKVKKLFFKSSNSSLELFLIISVITCDIIVWFKWHNGHFMFKVSLVWVPLKVIGFSAVLSPIGYCDDWITSANFIMICVAVQFCYKTPKNWHRFLQVPVMLGTVVGTIPVTESYIKLWTKQFSRFTSLIIYCFTHFHWHFSSELPCLECTHCKRK